MNKKNISLILIGILLLVLQFYVRVGNATIDVFSDVIGFILIVIGIFNAFGTFLLRQFFLTLPRELEEAAMIDGCSYRSGTAF